MTITSSGPRCDVCGDYIFGLTPDDLIYPFSCTGIKQTLHSCKDCKKILLKIGSDWKRLPKGPLRKAFNPTGLCIVRDIPNTPNPNKVKE